MMRISYDEKTDALYLRLKETTYYESDEVKQGILLDYDDKGNLIAIEILDASQYLSADELASLTYNVEKAITR
jgi:uncharacterized protein YuzE